jgi:hypothetical protein
VNDTIPSPPPLIIDEPGTPDIFAANAPSFFIHNGAVYISLETVRLVGGTERTLRREIIGRLVMPQSAAEVLVEGLGEFLKKQRKPVTPRFSGPRLAT